MSTNESFVVLDDGWILCADGTLKENSPGGFGMTKNPENEYERFRLIVKFWETKLDLAIEEFDNRKSSWLVSAKSKLNFDGNPGGTEVPEEEAVAVLNTLKARVNHCKAQLAEAEQKLEKHTPPQLKKNESITEANRQRITDFCGAIDQIEI